MFESLASYLEELQLSWENMHSVLRHRCSACGGTCQNFKICIQFCSNGATPVAVPVRISKQHNLNIRMSYVEVLGDKSALHVRVTLY